MESDAKHGHPHCVTFWYHMYGPHVATLNVYKKSGGSMVKLWSRKGDNGDQWRYAQIDVSSTIKYQIAIEAVRGTNYKGDISIDDIDFVDGTSPPTISCDFEHGFCDAKPDPKMEFTWTRNKGATASKSAGPSIDHTLQTDQGYYIYTEMSGRRRYGDSAHITVDSGIT